MITTTALIISLPSSYKNELTAVTSFDGKSVIAVGLNGIVLTSSNSGEKCSF